MPVKPNLNSVKSFLRMDQRGVDGYLETMEEAWNAQESYGRLSCLASGGGAFDTLLKMAKMQWRFGLANPTPTLKKAAELATRLAPKFRTLSEQERYVANFPFASAGFVFLLLEGSVPKPIQACWPKDPEVNPSYTETVPDAMLLRTIASGKEPSGWQIMLTSSLNKHSSQFVIETYWTYMAIVVAAKKKKWDEALEHARAADAMYPKREKQANQFRSSDGGSTFNSYMVDHRLAAILKVCFEPKKAALKDFDSVHLWKPTKSRRA